MLHRLGTLVIGVLAAAATGCDAAEVQVSEPPPLAALETLVDASRRGPIESATAAVEASSRSSEAWRALGRAYEVANLPAQAATCYGSATALAPDDARTHYRLAVVTRLAGDTAAAARCFERVIELDASYGPAWRRLGFIRLDDGDVERARTAFERARALLPDVADAYVGLARTALLTDEVDAAVEHAVEAHARDPEGPYTRLVLGEALRRAGRAAEAAPHLHAGAGSTPSFVDPWSESIAREKNKDAELVERGQTLESERRFVEALALYDDVLSRRPDDSKVLYRKGVALLGAGRTDDALAHLEDAHARFPGNYELALSYAGALRAAQRTARAEAATAEIIARWPDRAGAHFIRGETLRDAGHIELARGAFARATAIDPGDFRARLFEGRMLLDAERYGEARQVLEAGLEDPAFAPPLVYFRLLMAAQVRTGATPSELAGTYARAEAVLGDEAEELTQRR